MDQIHDNIIEKTITEAISTQKNSVRLHHDTDFNEIREIIRVHMRNHPEIFWFSHQYNWDEKTSTLCFKYNFAPNKKCFFESEIKKAVSHLFQPDKLLHLSNFEKVGYVYKWIAANTTYNEYSSFNQTIYSVLINRNSVCTGYAKTAQYLLSLLGVESRLVFGKFHTDKSNNGRHCWNIVKIDDIWYHVDFCLADPELKYLLNAEVEPIEHDGVLWNYFCTSTGHVLMNRSIEYPETYPECRNEIKKCPEISLLKPTSQYSVCKSDSGSFGKIFLDSFEKGTVIKVARNTRFPIFHEYRCLSLLNDCEHIIKEKGHLSIAIKLEQLVPWSELLNSHYYHPDEQQLKDILIQLTEGLSECREKGITYTDIHYNNIFISKEGQYKWGDFGIAFESREDDSLPSNLIGEDGIAIGSRWFMAPEMFHRKTFRETSAIYSLAMIAYFVMNYMRPPFWTDDRHQEESLANLLDGKDIPQPMAAERFAYLWPIIKGALSFSPSERPSCFEDFIQQLNGQSVIIDAISDSASGIISVDSDENELFTVDINHDGALDEFATTDCNDSFSRTQVISYREDSYLETDLFARTSGIAGPDKGSYDTDYFTTSVAISDRSGIRAIEKQSDCCSAPPKEADLNQEKESYFVVSEQTPKKKPSIWSKIFGKKRKEEYVNASAYAPAKIQPLKDFMVRIFIHREEEAEKVDSLVKSIDINAIKKAYKPLDLPVKDGDKISVIFTMSDGVRIDESRQTFIWQGKYLEADYICKLMDGNLESVVGKAVVTVNEVPRGELKFIINVEDRESGIRYAKVESRRYTKIFISYAHADYAQVRGIAEGCRINGSDYFFDRHTLKAGDIFKDRILEYINNADLFVLCWSENAAKSEWVQIERKHALHLIENGKHSLSIYPLSMPPAAPLPEDMADKYNFATL